MNVVFLSVRKELDAEFIVGAAEEGLHELKDTGR